MKKRLSLWCLLFYLTIGLNAKGVFSFTETIKTTTSTSTSTSTTYVPTPPTSAKSNNGNLYALPYMPNTYALHLWGNSTERGYAHGQLLTQQILDFVECYIISTEFENNIENYNNYLNFLQNHFSLSIEFMSEIQAIYQGMQYPIHNNVSSNLWIPSLQRSIGIWDLVAINAYGDVGGRQQGPYLNFNIEAYTNNNNNNNDNDNDNDNYNDNNDNSNSECTQFLGDKSIMCDKQFWAARNMDGECDSYRVTITHLIVFGIDMTEDGMNRDKQKQSQPVSRWISIMWPGFVGSYTAFNEAGFYVMLNAGNMGPASVVSGYVPMSWQVRSLVTTFTPKNVSSEAIVGYLHKNFALDSANASLNGTSPSGNIVMIGWPDNNADVETSLSQNLLALEMDRLQNVPRFPNQTADLPLNDFIIATNHFHILGVNATRAQNNNIQMVYGLNVALGYWSSSWRYITGVNRALSMNRTQICIDGQNDLSLMLQSVSHGTTEHSVIVHATDQNTVEFWLAIAAVDSTEWDAPYRPFHKFQFDDAFQS